MQKKFALLPGILIVLTIFAAPVSANHRQEVLGDSTISSSPSLPATSDGPGLILPDSPFYFLDTLKQNIKLFLAFTPEQKAAVNADIAGERLAEVRFELAKDNTKAAQIALEGVADHLSQASDNLTQAHLQGRDVTELAQNLNENIKEKRNALSELEDTSSGELKARVGAIQASLLESKIKVEDALPSDQLEQEVENDLNDQIETEVANASESASGLEHSVDILEKLASQAAEKNQTQREKALEHAIEVKNDALKKQQGKALEDEKKKIQIQQQTLKQARDVAKKTQEAAQKFQELKTSEESTTSGSSSSTTQTTITPTPSTSTSGDSGGSTSGSTSGSGSGDSGSSGSGSSGSGSHSGDDH